MNPPKISVIMGVFNCQDTFTAAINSILGQTYSNWELIICDDASTDDTFIIAKHFERLYADRIRLIRNDKNQKLAYSLNRCLEYTTGDYIARMDGDDTCSPKRFEIQINFLKQHPEVDLCGTSAAYVSADGKMLKTLPCCKKADRNSMHYTVPFVHASIMAKKEVYTKLNGYTVLARTVRCEDCDLWYRFFKEGFIGMNIPDPLYFINETKASIMRRTWGSRLNSLKTDLYGYHLLQYPWWWYYKPFLQFSKVLVPRFLVVVLRKLQGKMR